MIDRNADILDRLLYAKDKIRGPGAPLVRDSITEIEKLRTDCQRLVKLLMSEYVVFHERLIEELDETLKSYLGNSNG